MKLRPVIPPIDRILVFCLLTTAVFGLAFGAVLPAPALAGDYEVDLRGQLSESPRNPVVQEGLSRGAAWSGFLSRNRGWTARWSETRQVPVRAHGPGVALGGIVETRIEADRAARDFFRNEAGEWVLEDDLRLVRAARQGSAWWMQYAQYHQGLRVVNGRAYMRISRQGAVPLFGLETYPDISGEVTPVLDAGAAFRRSTVGIPGTEATAPRSTELVILPMERSGGTAYRLAYQVEFTTTEPEGAWVAFVDAKDGDLLWRFNNIRYADVSGTVSGDVELLQAGDPQNRELLPHLGLSLLDGITVVAEDVTGSDGAYTITPAVDGTYTLSAPLAGPFGVVYNNTNGGATPVLETTVNTASPITADFVFEDANSLVQDRDAFYWAMISHDYIQQVDSGFDLLDYPMPIVTDLFNNECNAFWNGEGITFFPQGPNCTNTARSASVVIHEYGHGITDFQYRPFFASGSMHEGFSDYYSATILDDPVIGHGFRGPGTALRTIDNTLVFPDDIVGEVHADGLIIGAALWDVREVLGAGAADSLFHFARYGLSNTWDDYFFDYLVTDDDDGNVYNGTPNFDTLVQSFQQHGIGDYSIGVSHLPVLDTENLAKTFPIQAAFLSIFPLNEATVELHLEFVQGGGTTPETRVMTPTGGVREFESVVAAQPADTEVRYWFTAQDTDGNSVTYPAAGAAGPFSFRIGTDATPPVVAHEFLRDQPQDVGALRLLAHVTDNLDLGVGQVQVVHTQGAGPEVTTPFSLIEGDAYQALLPFSTLNLGDVFQYRVEATDLATVPNQTLVPDTDWISFQVVRGFGRDLEADNGGLLGNGEWEWGAAPEFLPAFSGTNVWATSLSGPYSDELQQDLVWGPIDLSQFTKAGLFFRHRYVIEPDFDGGAVFASSDAGVTWDLLIPNYGYPTDRIIATGLPGYSGTQDTWALAEFDLSRYLGESDVRIQFRFTSDQALSALGWYLDDLELVERQVLAAPLGLNATSGKDGSVPLRWGGPAGIDPAHPNSPILGYHVYRAETSAELVKITTSPLTAPAFVDDTPVNGVFYTYAVTAVYSDGESPFSAAAQAIPFVSVYNGSTESLTPTVEVGQNGSDTLSFINDGTGFLNINVWPADPGENLDDVRVRYGIPEQSPGAPRRELEPFGAGAASADAGAKSTRPLEKGDVPVAHKGASLGDLLAGRLTHFDFRENSSRLELATPPTGVYEVLFVDPADAASGSVPDFRNLEAQVDDGSLFFKITSYRNWGNLVTDFNIAISMDTDLNPDTGPLGDFILLAGVIPMGNFGTPVIILDANFNPISVPHHRDFASGVSEAEFGFFLEDIGSPELLDISLVSLDPSGQQNLDLLPDAPQIPWVRSPVRHLEVFQGQSQDLILEYLSEGLAEDTYEAVVLLETNDPGTPEVVLPLTLVVGDQTPVRLLSFLAESGEMGVRLSWEITDVVDHAGFHLYRRETPTGLETRITEHMLRGDGGGRFVYEDPDVEEDKEYLYRLGEVSRAGMVTYHGPVAVRFQGASLLTRPVLRQNAPNPVRNDTRIRFGLAEDAPVTIRIFSIDGRLVRTLVTGTTYPRGFHEVIWDGRDNSGRKTGAGVYTYRLITDRGQLQRKLVVVP